MQGLTFMYAYHDIRSTSSVAAERQEAEYNMARAFHMLGKSSRLSIHVVADPPSTL